MNVERILHHFPLDPASRQARLALGEKRLAFTETVVRYWERPETLTALNPSGFTPVLVEGDLVLCEASAILGYLEEVHAEPPLMPQTPADRAETRRLINWFDRKFAFEAGDLLLHEKMEKRLHRLGAPDLANLRQGREGLRAHLAYIETLLAERDWLAGRRLTLADLAAAAHLSVIDYLGDVPWAAFPGAKTWYMKLKSRPSFRPLLADRWPGIPPARHYDDLDF
ncbi:glutathione S-transferase family protein [Phenylobacterium immobile]|uniref:FtsZ-binding protein FzlA n=1 Tax=Phenylobacterium immobile TaxID=21 RepID=UPI000A7BADBB|nr:glutathione S-transferase family protein [Phenylobacterium immobile]